MAAHEYEFPRQMCLFQTALQCFGVFSRKRLRDLHLKLGEGLYCLEMFLRSSPFPTHLTVPLHLMDVEILSALGRTVHMTKLLYGQK